MNTNYRKTQESAENITLQKEKRKLIDSIVRFLDQADIGALSSIYYFVLHIIN